LLLLQEGTAMFSVDLRTSERDGLAVTPLASAFSLHAGVDEAASSLGPPRAAVPGPARPAFLPAT
jgi:hypothetical protein